MIPIRLISGFLRQTATVDRLGGAIILGGILLVATAGYEFSLYRHQILRFYSWDLSWWDHGLIFWTILAKSLVMMTPCLAFAWGLARWGYRRIAVFVALLGILGVLAYTVIDVKIQAMTGQHLLYYLRRAVSRHAIDWAGDPSRWIGSIAPMLGVGVSIVAVMVWILRRRPRSGGARIDRDEVRRGIKTWRIVLGVWVGIVGMLPIARRAAHHSAALERLHAALPHTLGVFHPDQVADAGVSTFGRRVDGLFDPLGKRLLAISRRPVVPELTGVNATDDLPDLWIIILESFRHDSVTAELMPRFHAMAKTGMIATGHSSGSNCSPQGSFAILNAQRPVTYDALLDGPRDAAWCQIATQLGYQTHLTASCEFAYRRMDEMFSSASFDSVTLHVEPHERWPEADRRSLAVAGRWLNREHPDARGPQMAVSYLMSTHFDYRCDDEAASAAVDPERLTRTSLCDAHVDESLELRTRYVRSLHFIDRLLSEMIASIDLQRSIVVVTGDHGESLYDDGFISHGSRLSEIQHGTPLVMLGAGVTAGTVSTWTSHIDLLPMWLGRLPLGRSAQVAGFHGVDWLDPHGQRRECRLLVQEYPDAWDLGLQHDQGSLLLNVDRNDGTTRVIGWLDSEGAIESERVGGPSDPELWADRFADILASMEPG